VRDRRAERLDDRAHGLRRHHQQDRLGARGSARSRVTAMLSSIRTPRRNLLSRCCASCSALPASYSHNVTLRPARAVTLASAVPHAPPPSTAMRSKFIG
jgi:hypothetical protein